MTSLEGLGRKHGTDKVDHGYLPVYERYLSAQSVRGNLLEIGWWEGDSMRMWREALPDWGIVGVDIEEKDPIEGVSFVKADQTDQRALDLLAVGYGPWDVIIDDASHLSPHTERTFRILWPHLKSGGLYFVEDLQVSYHLDWGGEPNPRRGMTTMNFLKRLADDVHYGHANGGPAYTTLPDVARVEFVPGLCVVEKR